MIGREIAGVAIAVLVVAGISAAIVRGSQTSAVISAAGTSFKGLVQAATLSG